MWPQPPSDINIMRSEPVLKQGSKAVSAKKAALPLEQRFALQNKRPTPRAIIRALPVITTLNHSILEVEGAVKEHLIQLFHFTDWEVKTQSS